MLLSGVIEGFYGRAWSRAQRVDMLDWIVAAGMNCFIYGPKDDIKVRARWRETYDAEEADDLADLVEATAQRGLNFMVAIAPCLDVTYSDATELEALKRRLDQLLELGVSQFVLLFDDIPATLSAPDQAAFPNFAAAQAHLANAAFAHVRAKEPRALMVFCPTEYCAAFAGHDVPGSGYLDTLGRRLDPAIKVFWTGPDIVSETISAASLAEVGRVLRRKPVIWDNFHANDYDIRRVHAGPLGGRGDEILPLIDGIISNPNNEFEANFVAVHTTGALVRGGYDEAAAFEAALAAWQTRFRLASSRETIPLAELRLLAELHYQPFRCGPTIEALLGRTRQMLASHRPDVDDAEWQAGHRAVRDLRNRIRDLFHRTTELENRDLFYAFNQYLWEVREEVTHLCTYLDWLAEKPATEDEFPGRERIYNFYRQGFSVAVQDLLRRDASGRYHHGA